MQPAPNFKNNVLAAIRKKGAFEYNRFNPKQRRDYRKVLDDLEVARVVICSRQYNNKWLYTQGPEWNRRA
jgi:hypothetical protein